jgi:hypothetical protein
MILLLNLIYNNNKIQLLLMNQLLFNRYFEISNFYYLI